jgi:hypothetical protein
VRVTHFDLDQFVSLGAIAAQTRTVLLVHDDDREEMWFEHKSDLHHFSNQKHDREGKRLKSPQTWEDCLHRFKAPAFHFISGRVT